MPTSSRPGFSRTCGRARGPCPTKYVVVGRDPCVPPQNTAFVPTGHTGGPIAPSSLQCTFDSDPGTISSHPATHDNDTMNGWWAATSQETRIHAGLYIGILLEHALRGDVAWDFVRAAMASVARTQNWRTTSSERTSRSMTTNSSPP